MALGVRGFGCVGWIVLVCCVLLGCALSVWLYGLGLGRGSRVPGPAWPWVVVVAGARRPA